MAFWDEDEARTAPADFGGDDDWTGIPVNRRIEAEGWTTEPVTVADEDALRQQLRTFSRSTEEGPFVIELAADIRLHDFRLGYRGDELLVVLGHGYELRAANGHRILYATGPVEVNGVELRARPVEWPGRAVYGQSSVTVVANRALGPRLAMARGEVDRIVAG
jgi:hypothetical protein